MSRYPWHVGANKHVVFFTICKYILVLFFIVSSMLYKVTIISWTVTFPKSSTSPCPPTPPPNTHTTQLFFWP